MQISVISNVSYAVIKLPGGNTLYLAVDLAV